MKIVLVAIQKYTIGFIIKLALVVTRLSKEIKLESIIGILQVITAVTVLVKR